MKMVENPKINSNEWRVVHCSFQSLASEILRDSRNVRDIRGTMEEHRETNERSPAVNAIRIEISCGCFINLLQELLGSF
jgi:hypothetical protein